MNQEKMLELDAGEVNLLRILLHCLKFGFQETKLENWEYVSSPVFTSIFKKVDEYSISRLTHSKDDRLELYRNEEVILEISKKVIEIVSSISEWENLPEAERTRIVTDLFYPYMPGIQTLENIIKRNDLHPR